MMKDETYVRIVSSGGHLIDIDPRYLILEEETSLTFEFDFNWDSHAHSCEDCKALLWAILPIGVETRFDNLNWYTFIGGKFRLIDFFRFGDSNDPESGYLMFSSRSANFQEEGKYVNENASLDITRLRLMLLPSDPGALEPEILISEYYGNIRRCDYLVRALRQN